MTQQPFNPQQPGFGVPGSGSDVNRLHDYDDIDISTLSHHHSLGIFPGQSSPGDHIHDGKFSKKLTMNNLSDYISGAYNPIPTGAINAFNAGVASGRYQKYGRLMQVQMKITFSATTTYFAGVALQVPLPFPFYLRTGTIDTLLTARLLDTSAGQVYNGTAIIDAATDLTSIQRVNFGAPSTGMTSTNPITLASGDILFITGSYETN